VYLLTYILGIRKTCLHGSIIIIIVFVIASSSSMISVGVAVVVVVVVVEVVVVVVTVAAAPAGLQLCTMNYSYYTIRMYMQQRHPTSIDKETV